MPYSRGKGQSDAGCARSFLPRTALCCVLSLAVCSIFSADDPKPDENPKASVVDLSGLGGSASFGETAKTTENQNAPGKISKPAAANVKPVPSGDAPRFSQSDDDAPPVQENPATDKPAPKAEVLQLKSSTVLRDDDPERRKAALADVVDAPTASPNSGPNAKKTAAASDAPRFVSGRGLDSEAQEVAAELALEARKKELEPPIEPAAVNPAIANPAKPSPDDPKKQQKTADVSTSQKPGAIRNGSMSASEKNSKNTAAANLAKDPEEGIKEALRQIAEKNKQLAELQAEQAQHIQNNKAPEEDIHARDYRAKRLLQVLSGTAPMATLSGRVVDINLRPLPARVQVVDVSNTSVDAPVDDGFFCNGQFSAKVLSGPVKITVTHGRFLPTFLKGVDVKPNIPAIVDVPFGNPGNLNFASKGWYLADLDFGLQTRPGQRSNWMGKKPTIQDLIAAARAEDVHILGVPLPWGDANDPKEIEGLSAGALQNDVLLLPVFPGPRSPFYGSSMGLGVRNWDNLHHEIVAPEVPLCEAFEDIHASGGLAVYKDFDGNGKAQVKRDIFPLFPQLESGGIFPDSNASINLYAANGLPFDTVSGPAYDLISFDGSETAERLWFNLLSQGYEVSAIGASGGSLESGRLPYGQTFIHVDGKVTREKVLDSIKRGRTTVSFGPAAFFKVFERDMESGSVLQADGHPLTLQIQAYASMAQGSQIDHIDIIRNGEVVHTQECSVGEAEIKDFRWPISESSTAWYMVRVVERRNIGATSQKVGSAWTSPIFFRGVDYAPPKLAHSHIKGVLRAGLTPIAGTVTAVVPGQPTKQIRTENNGTFSIDVPASATLIFDAPESEPLARRVFENTAVQRALARLETSDDLWFHQPGSQAAIFQYWSLLLSELRWDISLGPKAGLPKQIQNDTNQTPPENH